MSRIGVKLGEILCGTRGLSPISSTTTKRAPIESISGVDWFYFLVPDGERQCLINHVGAGQIDQKFIACAKLPRKNGKSTHVFAAFNGFLDFLHYIKNIPRENWYFYEVILGSQTQKLYFDIDIAVNELLNMFHLETPQVKFIDDFVAQLLTSLIIQIMEAFNQRGIKLNMSEHILLFNSNSDKKRSFHVIVNKFAVSNCEENAVLANEIIEGVNPMFRRFIDQSMYSKKQQFRLYQSQKSDGRRKIFMDKWTYWTTGGPKLIEYQYPDIIGPDEETTRNLKFTMIFKASCITVIDECQVIPVLFEEPTSSGSKSRKRTWDEKDAFDNTEIDITDEFLETIFKRVDPIVFQIYKFDKTLGPLVLLRRKTVAHCTLCNRVHENENAFLRLNRFGKVYFYCRRNEEKSKIIADVCDLMQNDLVKSHAQSLIQQLTQQPVLADIKTPEPPTAYSKHSQLRTIANQGGSPPKIKTQNGNLVFIYV